MSSRSVQLAYKAKIDIMIQNNIANARIEGPFKQHNSSVVPLVHLFPSITLFNLLEIQGGRSKETLKKKARCDTVSHKKKEWILF